MATMGTGKMSKKDRSKQPETPSVILAAPTVNLIVGSVLVQPISTFDSTPSTFGAPIMREGFITRTGDVLK